ncbi:ankyrin repeat domain-containing protein 2-like [Clarias magur]|uniref:Ankyrin repeat domain-containing protein 2-like n=1 Tax=Clarias magur TaxID=1594786 RepID=A0A8J5CA79_CLAMG|nr:ankyrin repeat domain-containing protein 2-like [Clarias magur]
MVLECVMCQCSVQLLATPVTQSKLWALHACCVKCRTCAQKLGILTVDDTKDKREMNNEPLNENFAKIQAPVDCEKFLEAATNGDLKVVDKFLKDGGDPNTSDEFRKSALHRAAYEGHVKIVERLLDKGASIDFQDRLGCTAVHWASRGGSLDALKLLQSSGADLNVKDKVIDLYGIEMYRCTAKGLLTSARLPIDLSSKAWV